MADAPLEMSEKAASAIVDLMVADKEARAEIVELPVCGVCHENRPCQGYKIKWAQEIGPAECPMMRRWVFEVPWFSVRLHHFIRPDDMRHLHDHPWWFVTLLLRGSYTDITERDGVRLTSDRLRPGSIRFRPANHVHAVDTAGCWSLVVTGPISRRWGFWDRGLFRGVSDYFRRYGYAPCE